MLEHVVLAVLDLRRGRDGAEIQGGWLLRDHDFDGSRGAPYCRARPVGEQEDGLVHVPHGIRREHRLVLLDQGHHVRSRDVAMIDDDEPRPVDVLAEADARNAAARGGTPHRHAPQEVVEREIVHVPLASRELRECFTTQHAGILSSCCAHGQGVTLRTLSLTLGVTVNGARYERAVEPRLLLPDFLRHELGLTGRPLFVDDVRLDGMLHVAFLRSQHAHARLSSVDASAARTRPGVVAVYTANDLGDYWRPGPLLVPPPPIAGLVFNTCTQVPLAKDKLRHVGEPIAMVVAESRYVAEDALDDIVVEAEPLPAVVDLEAALAAGTPRVHDQLPSNLAAHAVQRKGDYARARAQAHTVIARRFRYDRGASAAIENRAVVAQWDPHAEELTVWDTTQAPLPIRNGLAQLLGLLESQVRVVAPFVGGGFGPKIMMYYPEEVLIPWAAMRLGRPVKWTEDRQENFFATTQERGQIHDAELAVTKDGKILGVRDVFLHDTGAYDPYGLSVAINSQCTLLR